MKALFYTLVLTAILIGVITYLRTIEPEPRQTSVGEETDLREPPLPRSPMAVMSEPAPRSGIDASELERANLAALYETGTEMLDLWHVPEAIEVFETLLHEDSLKLDAHLRLVECYAHPTIGAEAMARARFRNAMELAEHGAGDTLWVAAIGDLFVDVSPTAAIDKLSRLMDREVRDPGVPYFLAMALMMDGRPQDAEPYLEELLEADQSLGRARELLIQCKVARAEFESAERLARDLASIYPEEPYPYVLLSRVLLIEGKVPEAIDFANNALLLDSRYVPAIVARAHLYIAENHFAAARVSFEKLFLFDDAMLGSVATEGLAHINFLTGHFDTATEEMHEAIRRAMSVDATRRGLLNAFRLVDYLAELGRPDAAMSVVDRWMTRQGEIPERLGRLRVRISQGDPRKTRAAFEQIRESSRWQMWMRALGMDQADIEALTFIRENNFAEALRVLDTSSEKSAIGARRPYLKGFAHFQNGDAELAANFFEQARFQLHSLVFPYHSDPILYVQSIFFLAETALARGEADTAAEYYREFLDLWGDADWELQAVSRAREKLETLSLNMNG